MRVLVIGSGAREHAITWKLKHSRLIERLFCAPGNPGMAEVAECVNVAADDIPALLDFAVRNEIDLTVPGPEAPLVKGIVDAFEAQGLAIFGPSRKAAELEGSKAFSKWLMQKYHIPTAEWSVFYEFDEARHFLTDIDYPCVIKADGLAAGKGAIVVENFSEGENALRRLMVDREFGDAGRKVVIEEFLRGVEVSVFAITDGERYMLLPLAQDHKPIFDNDEGPNTGGMGAYAPAPVASAEELRRIALEIIEPTIRAMAREKRPYRGVLYAGLMLTASGPKVIEFNCRFGDPEAQVVLPLLKTDLLEIMQQTATRSLFMSSPEIGNRTAVCVVMASGGYPGKYESGKTIFGIEKAAREDVIIFHAGTKRLASGALATAGGRVLSVVAVSESLAEARKLAYNAVGRITFDGAYYRRDIGARALKSINK